MYHGECRSLTHNFIPIPPPPFKQAKSTEISLRKSGNIFVCRAVRMCCHNQFQPVGQPNHFGTLPAPCPFPGGGGVGDRHLVNPKRAKPPPKGAVQSITVESGEHVQEFKVKWSRTKKFYTQRVKE